MLLLAAVALAVIASVWLVARMILPARAAGGLGRGIMMTFKMMMIVGSLGFVGLLIYAAVMSS